jgi:predicted nucleic acid-binding protein
VTLVCDTSVLYAAIDRSDRAHEACASLLASSVAVIVPSPTVVEIDQLAHSRDVPEVTSILLDALLGGDFALVSPDLEDHDRILSLVEQYRDLPLGFVDASVVTAAERLGETTIATLDHGHFSVVKPLHCEGFTLVP